MALGGEIVVQLRMDDGQFRPAIVRATDMVRAYKEAVGTADSAVQRLERSHDTLGRRFRDIVLTMGNLRFVAMDINDIFLRLPVAILKSAGELERMQQLMTGLSKESDKTRASIEGLRDMNFVIGMAKNAPFEMKALSDAFVKLKTAGIDPANGSMKALVDSVARFGGTDESLRRASVAIQQMAGKGVVSMEELRQQLGEATPTAMQAMADGMGMTVMELTDKVSKGMVVAGPALRKMLLQMKVENDGAAQDMMQTWTGMTSQLKTEMTLMAKLVADSGFGNATKTEIAALLKEMQGDGLKRFASDFGSLLGEIVTNLADTVRFMVKWGDEIKLALQAFLAFKVVTGIIRPLSDAIHSHYRSATTAIERHNRALTTLKDNQRFTVIEQERSSAAAARAEMQASAARMAELQRELEFRRAMTAQMRAEMAKLYQPLANGQTPRGINGRFVSAEAVREQIRDISRLESAHNTAIWRMQSELARLQASHAENARAVLAHGNQIDHLTGQMGRLDLATRAAGAAKRTLSFAMDLVGGKVGLVLMAIGLMAEAYRHMANAADRAAEAKNRVMNNVATRDDVKDFRDQEAKLRAQLATDEAELKSGWVMSFDGMSMPVKMNDSYRAALVTRINQTKQELAAISKLARDAVQSVEDQQVRSMLTSYNTGAEREIEKIREKTRAEVAAVRASRAKVKEEIDKGQLSPDERLKREKEYRDLTEKATSASLNGLRWEISYEQLLIRQAEARKARAREGTQAYNVEVKILTERTRNLEQLQSQLETAEKTRVEPVQLTASKKKGKDSGGKNAANPLRDLLEQLNQDRARLKAEMDGLSAQAPAVDKAAMFLAEVEEKLKGDKFRGYSDAQKTQVMDVARVVAQQMTDIEALKDAAKNAEKFTTFVEGLRPGYEDALKLLMNPLESVKSGSEEARVKVFISKNQKELADWAKTQGKTFEEIERQWLGMASVKDAGPEFQKIAQETRQITESIVNDSRAASRARMLAENERHYNAMNNLIREKGASGLWTEAQVEQAQKILEDNRSARTADTLKKTESPLEKLQTQWADVTRNMEEATASWANGAVQAFTDLVTTGKASFSDLARSVIADLVKIQVQKAMVGAIGAATSLFAFADGGIMTELGAAPLKKYASGGIANSPQLALFGEGSMPEAYVPLPDGRTIPVTLKVAGEQGGAGRERSEGHHVQIHITVNQQGSDTRETRSGGMGGDIQVYRQMGERIKTLVREELASQQRPGGMLYR